MKKLATQEHLKETQVDISCPWQDKDGGWWRGRLAILDDVKPTRAAVLKRLRDLIKHFDNLTVTIS